MFFYHNFKISKDFILQIILFISNFLEHLDGYIYIFLVPLIAPIFFPKYDFATQLICTYAIQLISIIAKPLGAAFFGLLAINRSPILVVSYGLAGVTITALLIAILPSYANVGYLSSVGLLFLRTISIGCAAGGSIVAATLLIENKPEIKALKSNYFYQLSTMLGIILASFIATIIIKNHNNHNNLNYLNWQSCFLGIGILGSIIWIFIKLFDYINNKKFIYKNINIKNINNNTNILNINWLLIKDLWGYKSILFQIALLFGFSQLTYVIPFVLFNSFIPLITNISLATMMQLNNSLLFFDVLMLLIIGRILFYYPAKKILIISGIVLSVSILPIFLLLPYANSFTITGIRLWLVLFGVIFAYPVNVWSYNLIAKLPNRYLLMGVGSAIGSSLIGKSATSVCLYLWNYYKSVFAPGIYLMILMLMTVAYIWKYRETKRY